MSALVTRMERAGWVERGADEVDRRAVVVRLSATGRRVLEEITATRARVLQGYLEALPAAERATVAAAVPVLKKIISSARQGSR
jgi:DNA-binding MarR family transcriptional regulator